MPHRHQLLAISALFLGASACSDASTKKSKPGDNTLPSEDFVYDTTIRIAQPANGRGVPSPLTMTVETGNAVEQVRVLANDIPIAETVVETEDLTEVIVELAEGRYQLRAEGLDADGVVVSEHAIQVRVVTSATEATPWVLVTSPRDGATVTNPVAFTVETGDSVDQVELFADDWSLGTIRPNEVLRYEFAGTDYARQIDAVAYAEGREVARDSLTITVTESTSPGESTVNDIILSKLTDYPTDGSYSYWWPDDSYGWGGNPSDLFYDDELFAQGDDLHRSYCVGITFEVFMRTFYELDSIYGLDGDLNGVSFDELDEFRKDWYVRDLYGTGIVEAMDNYGIGGRVTDWDEVRPGDIIQFWRHSGSGHNAIFIGWERDGAGTITGFTYWSTQGSTDGIGYNDEYFGTSGSRVDPNYFFVGRVAPPEDWTPWW